MDAISYAHSAKQEQRIKKFINDPDSTSGVLTVPKVIASGESVTIPAGRVAILPDVQVDGTLNVLGDIFIPTGTANSKVVQKVASTDKAIPRFNGTTGDVQNSGVIIDDNNNVGIGTNAPSVRLDINSTTNTAARLTAPIGSYCVFNLLPNGSGSGLSLRAWADSSVSIYNQLNSYMTFGTNNLERMRIDSAGNVGIGVIPSAWNTAIKAIQIGSGASIISPSPTETIIGANYYRNTSDINTYINTGYATKYHQTSGQHQWFTAQSGTAGSAITWANAMILDNSGNLLVGANTAGSGATSGFNVSFPTSSTVCAIGHTSGTASLSSYMTFAYNGTVIGNIYQSGTTSVVFNTTSDYRLKENVRPADCKKFMDIKFVDYERIDGRHECGVIAHELQEIYPDLVTGEKDATEIRKVEISPAVEEVKDEDGNIIVEAVEAVYEEQEFPVYQQVNYMGLIARIGTVVQQQAKLIEAMRAEIDELKGIGGAK